VVGALAEGDLQMLLRMERMNSYLVFNMSSIYGMLFQTSAFILLLLCIVVPNSLQVASLVALTFCALLATPILLNKKYWPLLGIHLLICIVTALQIIVGHLNGAPDAAYPQVFFIYMVSPLLWTLALAQLFLKSRDEQIFGWIIVCTILALVSIALFYYLFLTFGPESVKFFISTPNVNLTEGYAGATMFVYGSLIFICSGFFAAPHLIRNPVLKYALLLALAIGALSSGRSALILSILIGFFIGRVLFIRFKNGIPAGLASLFFSYLLVVSLVFVVMKSLGIDLALILGLFFSEILSGGGTERHEQFFALANGIIENKGLGSGHGIGVSYLRSEEFPWRYELIWVATVFRVGILGALIYSLPILYFFWLTFKRISQKKHTDFDIFFLAGFIASLIASATNPYIESFVFQWMLILPIARLVSIDVLQHTKSLSRHYSSGNL